MNKKTSTAIALVLGLAAPFAFSGAAMAVVVTFAGGETIDLSSSEAAAVCGIDEGDIVDDACTTTMTLAEYEDSLDDDGDGPSENSAAAYAPGQLKQEGESAREYAPGQQAQESGGSASDFAPGQVKQGNGD